METIRTRRLELITLTPAFLRALSAGDVPAAEAAIGARVRPSLVRDPSHVVQLFIAQESAGIAGLGRVIVLGAAGRRRAIGSIGFHGLPDDRGSLETSCRIQAASRGGGYAAEALTALLEWATARFGVRRFLVAVASPPEPRRLMPVDMALERRATANDWVVEVAKLIEG